MYLGRKVRLFRPSVEFVVRVEREQHEQKASAVCEQRRVLQTDDVKRPTKHARTKKSPGRKLSRFWPEFLVKIFKNKALLEIHFRVFL